MYDFVNSFNIYIEYNAFYWEGGVCSGVILDIYKLIFINRKNNYSIKPISVKNFDLFNVLILYN